MTNRSRLRSFAALAGLTTAAGVLSATPAFASGFVTAATGGTAMSANNAGPTATYTNLTGPSVFESSSGDVGLGRFALVAPSGFEFKTSANITVALTTSGNNNKRPRISAASSCGTTTQSSLSVTPTATAITFYVCNNSNDPSTFTFSGISVRPTASTPLASGNIHLDNSSGAVTISGVTGGASGANFGTLTENPGPTTQLGVSLPSSVTAGSSQSTTVTARDAYGNTATGYRGTVHFTSTDPSATVPANYAFTATDNGVHTFSGVVLKTAGNRSVTGTDTVTSSITGVASTTVTATTATTMTVTGIANPVTAGASASATVTLKDTYGNVATGYLGTVHFSSTDSAATLPANYTFTSGDAGTHTFTGLVLKTAGNQGVTTTDGTLSASQTPITVQPGSLDHLVLSPSSGSITAGTSRTFTAQGRDASNNNLGDITGTTTFTIAPNGSCTANSCTATGAGAHTVTGTKGGATGTASLQVNPAAPVVTVTLSPSTVAVGGTSTVNIQVADQYGNARAGDTVTVATDGAAQLSAVHDNGNGTYTATLTASTVAGTQTITATDATATGGAVLTQVPASASNVTLALSQSTVEADGTTTVNATITVADAYGNPRAGDTVTLTTSGDVSISALTDHGFGTYTATVTASTTAAAETLTATDGSANATAQLVELTPLRTTGVSPDTRGRGANGGAFGQSITVTGSGFTPGALADLGAGVTVKFTTYVDSGHLTAHVVVAPDAALGSRSVTVTVPDGRSWTCTACFTVTAGPTVSDVSPNQIGPGAQGTVTVTGTGFSSGVKVTVPASGVAVTSVTVVDSNHLSVGLSTAYAAAAGLRDLIVTNPSDAGSTTCSGCFSVSAGPVVTDISPNVLGGGAQTSVTVTGGNFSVGARLSFAGTGVAVVSMTRLDDSHLVANLSLASGATPGTRTVSVVNADGGRGSCSTCFSVSAAPAVTGITPSALNRGSSATVTITGTNFQPGASVSLSTGVTVTDVTVVDANTITATVSVSATTGAGSRTVLVTNPDLGKGTYAGFTVN